MITATIIEVTGKHWAADILAMPKPSDASEKLMKEFQSPNGWKFPQMPFITDSKSEADDYAYCLDWYLGGHELIESRSGGKTHYIITSKGYYHYIGA